MGPARAGAWRRGLAAGSAMARQGAAVARSGLRTQAIATIGLAPLSVLFFQQVSVVGFVANLLAIPLVTLLITPLALLGALWSPAWQPAAAAVGVLMAVLDLLAAWPWAQWQVPAAPWAVALGALAGAALWVAPGPRAWRALGLPMLWALLAWPAERPAPGHFELLVADIGQGNAVLVRTARHTLLYDSGPAYGRESEAGSRVLVPLLRALGEQRLDRLVLSHRDLDHTGGAAAVMQALPVDAVLSSLEPGHPLVAQAGARHRPCMAGQSWQWDGVRFEMLHPRAAEVSSQAGGAVERPNGLSCVLRIGPPPDPAGPGPLGHRAAPGDTVPRHSARTAAIGTALLAGDIERPEELALIDRAAAALVADVLLVPHHGSRTSSTAPFLTTVRPSLAVVQAGAGNRFGHPAPDVVQRYRDLGIGLLSTTQCGAWRWNGAKIVAPSVPDAVKWCERVLRQRYWQAAREADPGP
jgi:competence protein ComEC